MDPRAVSDLRRVHFVIETHPQHAKGGLEMLIQRFEPTHNLSVERSVTKDPARYKGEPWINSLDQLKMKIALDEFRGDTPWLLGVPNTPRPGMTLL
jgi:hypothetical protein